MQKLKNGLKFELLKLPKRELCNISLFVGVGQDLEPKNYTGANHFLEHFIFSGSGAYGNSAEFYKLLSQKGIYFNADTYQHYIHFYMLTSPRRVNDALDIMSKLLAQSVVKKSHIQNIKKIILQEVKDKKNSSGKWTDLWTVSDKSFWVDTPYEESIWGEESSIKNINTGILQKHFKKVITASNIYLFVAGDVDSRKTRESIKLFNTIISGKERKFGMPKIKLESSSLKFFKNDSASASVSIRLPCVGGESESFAVIKVLNTIIGGSDYSRLFINLREKRGLAYNVSSGVYSSFLNQSFIDIQFETESKNLPEAVSETFSLLNNIAKNGVTAEEVNIARAVLELSSRSEVDDIVTVADFYGLRKFLGTYCDLSKELAKLEKVKKEDVQIVAKKILSKKVFSVTILGLVSNGQKSKIRNLIKNV